MEFDKTKGLFFETKRPRELIFILKNDILKQSTPKKKKGAISGKLVQIFSVQKVKSPVILYRSNSELQSNTIKLIHSALFLTVNQSTSPQLRIDHKPLNSQTIYLQKTQDPNF